MNSIYKYIISFSVTILFSLLTFLFLLKFFHRTYGLTDASIMSGYISGIGSFFGGVVGGIVAFFATKIQLTNIIEKEKIESRKKYYNILRLLVNELEHNSSILKKHINPQQLDYFELLEDEVWLFIRFDANNHMPSETVSVLSTLYRDIRDMRSKNLDYSSSDVSDRLESINIILANINIFLENFNNNK